MIAKSSCLFFTCYQNPFNEPTVWFDIAYGGAYYIIVSAEDLGLDLSLNESNVGQFKPIAAKLKGYLVFVFVLLSLFLFINVNIQEKIACVIV